MPEGVLRLEVRGGNRFVLFSLLLCRSADRTGSECNSNRFAINCSPVR